MSIRSPHSTAAWLHEAQREAVRRMSRGWLWRSEAPTWLLIVIIYSGWFTALAYAPSLGITFSTLLLIFFTTWYLSLQHELIHGHPTRWARVNQLFGLLPLAVWFPYGLYRDSHLAHHRNDSLTLPDDDPETYYFSAATWARFSPWQRQVIRWRNTFVGRLLLAPALDIIGVMQGIVRAFSQRDFPAIGMWIVHALLLTPLLLWIRHCGVSVPWYLFAVSYPALAITKVRSFLEHRAADDPLARSVINEAGLPWRLLFLNLNYHSIHHDLPGIPWYGLPVLYRRYQQAYQQRNQGFVVDGYGAWWRCYSIRPVDVTVHPTSQTLAEESLNDATGHCVSYVRPAPARD